MAKQSQNTVLGIVWLLGLYAGLVHVTRHTWPLAVRDYRLVDSAPLSTLSTKMINLVTLGNRGLYDDLVAIWTIQSLMDKRLAGIPAEEIQKSLLTMSRHQPQIESFYMLSCFTLAMHLKRPDLCEPIALDGMKAVPKSWYIPTILAYIYSHQIKDPAKAAVYYGIAASLPDSPPYFKSVTQKMAAKGGVDPEDLEAIAREIVPHLEHYEGFSKIMHSSPSTPQEQERR